MAKGTRGGGEYKKVKGSSGKSIPKRSTVSQPSQQVVTPSIKPLKQDYSLGHKEIMQEYMPMESKMPYAPRILERSTHLQPRQTFDMEEIQKPETVPFRNTAIERLRD